MADSLAQQVLSLIFFVVLSRLLDPATFGIVSTAMIFIFLMRSTLLNAISSSLVTLPRPEHEDYDTAFWMLAAISTGSVLILNLAARPLALLYGIPAFEPVVRAAGLIVFTFGLGYAHYGWARRNFRFRELALRNLAGILVGGAAAIVLATQGYGLAALVANQLLAALVSLALLWILIPWKPQARFSRPRATALMSTALPQGATQSLQFAAQNFDTVLITYLLGPASGGLYAAAKRIVLALQLTVWAPVAAVLLPVLSEVADDKQRQGRLAARTAGIVMAVTAPVFLIVAACAPVLVEVLFGRHWLGAAPTLAILSSLGLSIPNMGVLQTLLMAQRRTRILLYFTLLQTLLAMTAIALSSPRDVETIAYCLTVPSVIAYIVTYIHVRRSVGDPIKDYLLFVVRPLLAAMLAGLAIKIMPDFGLPFPVRLAFMVVLGGSTYMVALFLSARDTFNDLLSFVTPLLRKGFR